MQEDPDLLHRAFSWLEGTGLGSITTAALATVTRAALGFDVRPRDIAIQFVLAVVVIAIFAPGLAEMMGLGVRGSAMIGATLAFIARPLVFALLRLSRAFGTDPVETLRRLWRRNGGGGSGPT